MTRKRPVLAPAAPPPPSATVRARLFRWADRIVMPPPPPDRTGWVWPHPLDRPETR